ncbi:hypothetical protein TSUD_51770 [Trifolium subterraneum]|uniref:Uncharacterized protein n=1 Tax=Trifolium subterraneum TaxID=3900 RepID=A0A2Z6LP59_TRISU|nr:hypothetical protein TSUD_51770 [Trifolium subterraneum]
MAANWSQLPEDLLQLISQKLNSQFYQLCFRSVCSSWRSSVPPNAQLFPTPLSKRTIILIKPSPNQQKTLKPFLIKIGPDSHGRTRLWNPLYSYKHLRLSFPQHIVDFNQLSVIDIGHEVIIGDFPFESSEYSGLSAVLTRKVVVDTRFVLTIHPSGNLAIFRSSDEQWTIIPEMPKTIIPGMSKTKYTDICIFNGRPIAVDSNGQTVAVGLDLSLDLVAKAVFGGDTNFLVESDGELLLVAKYLKAPRQFLMFDSKTGDVRIETVGGTRFGVFRLDEKEKILGDKILFLGEDSAFSVSASDLCMENGNCVIFLSDDVTKIERRIDVFCLDEQQISPLSDLPSYSELFWPPPQWPVATRILD